MKIREIRGRFLFAASGELHSAHYAFAFLHEDQLIGLDVFHGIHLSAGPADFEQLHLVRLAQAEVNPQDRFARNSCRRCGLHRSAECGFVSPATWVTQRSRAPMPLRFDLVPMVRTLIQLFPGAKSQRRSWGKSFTGLTTMSRSPSLSKSPKAHPRDAIGTEMPGPACRDTSSKRPVAQVAIEQLPLRITCFGFKLFDLGINVTVADENVRPAIVVHIEKAASPTQILGVGTQPCSEGGIFKVSVTEVVVKRRRISGKVRLYDIQVAVHVVIRRRESHAGPRLAIRTRAGMDAADERDLFAHVMTVGTECVGVFELSLISVARSGKQHHRRAGGHLDISDGRRRARHPEVSFDRAFHPQCLFEERRYAAAVLAQNSSRTPGSPPMMRIAELTSFVVVSVPAANRNVDRFITSSMSGVDPSSYLACASSVSTSARVAPAVLDVGVELVVQPLQRVVRRWRLVAEWPTSSPAKTARNSSWSSAGTPSRSAITKRENGFA